jgi:hypothetical protein
MLDDEDSLPIRGVADTDVEAHLAHQDAAVALWSWREEHLSELEPEAAAEEPKAHADDELVARVRNLNELRLEGVISDREFAAEREQIRRELGLQAEPDES